MGVQIFSNGGCPDIPGAAWERPNLAGMVGGDDLRHCFAAGTAALPGLISRRALMNYMARPGRYENSRREAAYVLQESRSIFETASLC
jgi:hypothetical protein